MLKKKLVKAFLCVAAAILLTSAGLMSCGGEDDLGGISKELSNRLTDALKFDDRTVKDGGQPESSDSSSAPQTDSVNAPYKLSLGDEFSIVFFSESVEADDIAGAVAWVKGADKYIEIDGEFDADSKSMTLSGYLDEDEELAGNDFSILLAMINKDGEVGNYFEWPLEILEDEEEEDGDISGGTPLACRNFADWSRRCGDFSYSCEGDEKCYTDEDSLCAYVDPDAAKTTILAACIKGVEQMFENDPDQAEQNLKRMDLCSACMIENLGGECYFPNEIDPSGQDQSQLAWHFLAPDCEGQCVYTTGSIQYEAITALKSLIGFNLTPDDLAGSLKTVCDL